jgi:hypothetical protein
VKEQALVKWLVAITLVAVFAGLTSANIRRFSIGRTSDIYEVNRLASLGITRGMNPYSSPFIIKTADAAYSLQYSYPPGGALSYSLLARWADIRWMNFIFALLAAFGLMACAKDVWWGMLLAAVFLFNPVTLEISSGFTASNEIIAAGAIILALLLYERYGLRTAAAIVLASAVSVKQFYFPLALAAFVYFWRADKKSLRYFSGTLALIFLPFFIAGPREFLQAMFGQGVTGSMVAIHFYSPWMFRSPSVYYLLLPVTGARAAAVMTLLYLSACVTVLVFLLEKIRKAPVVFSVVIKWFSLWLLFFLIGLPKFQLLQYIVLVVPGIAAYLCERSGRCLREHSIAEAAVKKEGKNL